jgi:hypothetical protein
MNNFIIARPKLIKLLAYSLMLAIILIIVLTSCDKSESRY